ncbi:MAG: VPS10 domain-containing protein [Bacteroidota bacterium]
MISRFTGKILLGLFLSSAIFAQPWMKNVRGDKENFYAVQQAFNQYWQNRKIERSKGWKPFKRWENFMESRVDENGYLDKTALWKAYLDKQARFTPAASADWKNLGPQKAIPSNGGGAGRINCVTMDPKNPNVIWVGSASGGLWKSADGGLNWSSNTDNLPVLGVSDIAIDPKINTTMYIASGDGDAGDTYSIGVLKSTDGGETWNTTGLSWNVTEYEKIYKLIIDPTDNNRIIAAATGGVFLSKDGGTTWTNVQKGEFTDIETDPKNPQRMYAASMGVGIYKSADGGQTWSKLTAGLPSSGFYRLAVAVSYSNPNVLYALYSKYDDYGFMGFYKSTDAGSTWTKKNTKINLLGWEYSGSDQGGQGWYDLALEVSAADENTVYVGGVNIWKTINGGTSWTINAHWYGDQGKPYVHADHHAFRIDTANPNTLYSGNDGGLFKTTNGGTTWTDLSNGLGIHQLYRIGVYAGNPARVMGGAQDNGSSLYSANSWRQVMGGDGMECAIDPQNPDIIYGEYYYGSMERSMDGGISFNSINTGILESGGWVTPFVMSGKDSKVLYKATLKVYKSANRGESWQPISSNISDETLSSLALAPSDNNYIYTGSKNALYRTVNGGARWDTLLNAPRRISYIAVHPSDPRTLYVSISGYNALAKVYKSTDAGQSWQNITGNLPNIPVNCIALNSQMPDQVYIGTDLGVFFTDAADGQWEDYSAGLPNVIINELEVMPAFNKVIAATYGRGLWESPMMSWNVPVELQSFTASQERSSIKLNWVTASESNNSGFVLERKQSDAWLKVSDIKGRGTTTEKSYYEYVDNLEDLVFKGILNYRLKQSDLSGKTRVVSDVKVSVNLLPQVFRLEQNYPNPFNPETKIKYYLPEDCQVTLKVFDQLGQEVRVLENMRKSAGAYEVMFNARGLASGVYVYELKAGNYTEAKKLTVLK